MLKIELVLLIPPSPVYNDGMEVVRFIVDFSLVSLVTLECDILHFTVKIEEMCEKHGIAYQSCYPKGPLKSLARKIQYKVLPLCCYFCLLQYYIMFVSGLLIRS